MKITTKNTMEINATRDEHTSLENANEMLGELLNHLENTCPGKGVIFYNPATGEIVEDEEIMRARAVLRFFLDNPLLEIRFQLSY